VTLGRDLSYCADNSLSRQDGKEAESNDGVRKKSRILEIRIILRYDLVELRYRLMKLGADAACEIIPERREFSQQERRTEFGYAIYLRHRRQDNVTFFHVPYSGLVSRTIETIYSGSESL